MRKIPFGKPIIGDEEKAAVCRVLDSGMLAHGPNVHAFEEAFVDTCGGGHAVSVSSCTAAMHLVYFAWGFGPGDEVIVPAQTHTATAHAVELTGATAVFVDAEPRTGNIDLDRIEAAITPRTRAIAVVHFLGMPVDMQRVLEIARRHDLKVVEDCALAIGTTIDGVHAGLHGDAGCFSFYPVKHITTAEGGMFVARDEETARLAAQKRAFGVDRTHTQRKVPGVYDVNMLGLNSRMSELQAALGRAQTARIPEILKIREANFGRLKAVLEGLERTRIIDVRDSRAESSHYCLSVVLEEGLAGKRTELIERLKDSGVGTSVYYPHPVPRLTYYREKYGYEPGRFRNAEELADCSIALPVGPHLNLEDMDYIADRFRAVAAKL